jgi:hypothetical protein
MRPAFVVPALDAAETVAQVVEDLRRETGEEVPVFVVDDGSRDDTAKVAARAGATVLPHPRNRGKGAAIRTGLAAALAAGFDVAVTVDADGQHPAEEAAKVLASPHSPRALVLGVRDFARSGAPTANRVGNAASNFFVSVFNWRRLRDTQCGLRRYPAAATLALRTSDQRFGFEAEVIFAARRSGIPVIEMPVRVIYPARRERKTHYRSVIDTLRIIHRIAVTVFFPVRWFVAGALASLALALAHPGIVLATRMSPPTVTVPADVAVADEVDPDLRWVERDYARHRGKILEVRLSGSPERIGAHHVELLGREMVFTEGELWAQLHLLVPSALARVLIFDVARLRFHAVDQGMTEAHRREIAASALALSVDPWADEIPSYQRMVYLHALYDVSLAFEHSPLLGCTSFALSDGAAEQGHTFLARNFDFEAGSAFDDHKAVFLVRETGRLGYASVAWPGLVGVVSGMNEAGVALVVHGARAGSPSSDGEPLVHTMREVLATTRTTDDAIEVLGRRKPMVSHMVMVADASGATAVVERAPGEPLSIRRGHGKLGLTNHFEGPLAGDAANLRVKRETSTLVRRARLDELLDQLPAGAGVEAVLAVLRDKRGPGGVPLPAGDRRAIDALIATHGVLMDTTARVMWVSEGPHLLGRFIRFDIAKLLSPDYAPSRDEELVTTSADVSAGAGLAVHQ